MSSDPSHIRILTTLGHVDHGKTTLMDYLLAANNVISPRMAGKMRYLDSREDEQERGITMESSAVSLKFQVLGKTADGVPSTVSYFINMVDTPGHVDFSSEVSTASRLCDGALLIVDVVEGVCTQTISVMRQAYKERLRPILIINKFDRLVTELQLTPMEAYHHLSRLIEQVNAVMGNFFAADRMDDDLRWREERERRLAEKRDHMADESEEYANQSEEEYQEKDDEDIYFAPEKGNVVFASAIHGWGFRVSKFAQLYSAKLGFKEANLRRVLWGDFFLDPKTKRVISYKHLRGRALKPLFVQFVLENIWAVYDAVMINPNPDKVVKITNALNVKIPPRDLKSKDTRHLITLIFSQWLSLSTCIIQSAIDIIPPPNIAQATRIPKMIYPNLVDSTLEPKNKLERDLYSCSISHDTYVCAYVSKMFAVTAKDLPENKPKTLSADEMRRRARDARAARESAAAASDADIEGVIDSLASVTIQAASAENKPPDDTDIILGFARLYSGIVKTGMTIYGILPKYNMDYPPTHPHNEKFIVKATAEGLYVMMGKQLIAVETVAAGNIFAVKGLRGKVWRSATLCAPGQDGVLDSEDISSASKYVINLGGVFRAASAIVRIAVESKMPADMPKLIQGLKLLSQSDPCVETFQQKTGEYVIVGAGELHLERCIRDLHERFAKVEIQQSKPIVPFRESAVKGIDMAPPKTTGSPRGTMKGSSSQQIVNFTIRASPMPRPLVEFIQDNVTILKKLQQSQSGSAEGGETEDPETAMDDIDRKPTVKLEEFWDVLQEKCNDAGSEWKDIIDRIWAFGPHNAGSCLLVDARPGGQPKSMRHRAVVTAGSNYNNLDSQIETGFQLATFQGPLCAEPVEGMCYFLESMDVDMEMLEKEIEQNRLVTVTGSLMSAARDACRNGLLDWSARLMLAMYSCDIQASTDVLGKVYAVVAKRRGRIVAEEMKEGTSFFTVTALVPVVESFGFSFEIRKRTSGAASPQLVFSGYELLDQDPFWVPTTEEELEDLGEKGDRANIAKGYMDAVRERKGMFVDKKIVEFAEKQRTLKK